MDAALDANSKQTATARLSSNELTIKRLTANPLNGALKVTIGTTGLALTNNWSAIDSNGRSAWTAVSNLNATTLVALEADTNGKLLINIS